MTKKICVLGSTGSIGTRTLDVARDFPEQFSICGLSTWGRMDLFKAQIAEFRPESVSVTDPSRRDDAAAMARCLGVKTALGDNGLSDLVRMCEPDIVVVATVGIAGLRPTLAALEGGSEVALANKEVLVAGGTLVMNTARKHGRRVIPIDSEHNAIAQCLSGQKHDRVRHIILTASGGPFRNFTREAMAAVTPGQALNHPTWNMGPKITIDSSTLMNKGFEVIEGHHLFDMPLDRIRVIVHPQSVVHSLVEFVDGSILAQLSVTDMYLTIQSALFFPERMPNPIRPLDLASCGPLTFEPPDLERFPCLAYAFEAMRGGGTLTAALNAANEIAVRRFLESGISFGAIPEIIHKTLEEHREEDAGAAMDLEAIFRADRRARQYAESL